MAVGAIVGSLFSFLWYWSWHSIVLEAFVSSFTVRVIIILAASAFCLGFALYVLRHWFKDDEWNYFTVTNVASWLNAFLELFYIYSFTWNSFTKDDIEENDSVCIQIWWKWKLWFSYETNSQHMYLELQIKRNLHHMMTKLLPPGRKTIISKRGIIFQDIHKSPGVFCPSPLHISNSSKACGCWAVTFTVEDRSLKIISSSSQNYLLS